jgi:hypothetical protein
LPSRVVQRASNSNSTWINKKHEAVATIISKIIARLDGNRVRVLKENFGGDGRIPPLTTLASEAVTSQLPEMITRGKRSWEFAATGLLDSSNDHDTQIVYVANDFKPAEVSNPGLNHLKDVPDLKDTRIKPEKRRYHAETRLAAEGCRDITVTGGKNCIFCSLYFLANGLPYDYHTGDVVSWHLPDQLTIAGYFGDDIAQYVTQQTFVSAFGQVTGTQALIDILTSATMFWR